MTRALILFAQPCHESFASAQHQVVVETLAARGWQIDDCDLYAEGFDPVMSESERRGYMDETQNIEPVKIYVERLRAADALIMVFPVWNYGFPAILKGFIDRVFLPGVSFRLEDGRYLPNLGHITKLAAVTSYGGSRWRTFLAGDPPRKVVTRALHYLCHRNARIAYLALHDMDRVGRQERLQHLDKLRQRMKDF